MEDVAAVDMMVQGFLYQVLGLITCQLCYPGEKLRRYKYADRRWETLNCYFISLDNVFSNVSQEKCGYLIPHKQQCIFKINKQTNINAPNESIPLPGVQEDKLHVQAGSEHKHVTMQFDFSHSARR